MNPALISRRDGAVLILSNNNQAARNALSPEYYHAVMDGLRDAAADASVAAVILTGEGGHFAQVVICANWLRAASCPSPAARTAGRPQPFHPRHSRLPQARDCRGGGRCSGRGSVLAMACDMLVAARNAVFSVAYVKVGLTPMAVRPLFCPNSCRVRF